jgi:hypothetical protein
LDNLENLTEEGLKQLSVITLFHGTVSDLDSILSKGILPWNEIGSHNSEMDEDFFGLYTPKIGHVYFAFFERARRYAFSLSEENGGMPIIIEAELDTSNLEPDEDSREKTWHKSLKATRTCSHQGNVGVEKIKAVYDIKGNIIYSGDQPSKQLPDSCNHFLSCFLL